MQAGNSSAMDHSCGCVGRQPERRGQGMRWSALAVAVAAGLGATSPDVRALTLVAGDTYNALIDTSAASLAELDIQGGRVLLGRAGAGSLTLTHPAVLREGGIFSYYPVSFDPAAQYQVDFLQGASLPGPVSGSYSGATRAFVFGDATNEGSRLNVFNHAAFTQSGAGALEVRTVALFTNLAGARYDMRNDLGLAGSGGFVNAAGASVVKSGGSGTSTVSVRLDSAGLIRAESGILELAAPGPQGNRYTGGRIETAGFSSVFFTGAHTMAGPVTIAGLTYLGSQSRFNVDAALTLASGSSLYLHGGSETHIAGMARLDLVGAEGSSVLTVSEGATLHNAGVIALGENTVLDVRGRLDGMDGTLTNVGGSTVIRAGASIASASYLQDSTEKYRAELVVDGTLDAYGTGVVLLSGKLSGSGAINGDLVVGCDPCAADLGTVFSPGNSPGTFTIHGGFTLLQSGELVLEVEKQNDGSVAFDRVIADATWLDGRVRFEVGAGVTDADLRGLSFLASAEPVEFGNHFNWVVTGHAGAAISFDGDGLRIDTLGTAPVPEPASGGLLLAGLVFLAAMKCRQRLRPASGLLAAGLLVGAAASPPLAHAQDKALSHQAALPAQADAAAGQRPGDDALSCAQIKQEMLPYAQRLKGISDDASMSPAKDLLAQSQQKNAEAQAKAAAWVAGNCSARSMLSLGGLIPGVECADPSGPAKTASQETKDAERSRQQADDAMKSALGGVAQRTEGLDMSRAMALAELAKRKRCDR